MYTTPIGQYVRLYVLLAYWAAWSGGGCLHLGGGGGEGEAAELSNHANFLNFVEEVGPNMPFQICGIFMQCGEL